VFFSSLRDVEHPNNNRVAASKINFKTCFKGQIRLLSFRRCPLPQRCRHRGV
jgi:hypothetical protein